MNRCAFGKRLAVLLAVASVVSAGNISSFSWRDYWRNRMSPDIVQERGVDGLDERVRGGKLELDIRTFLALVLKNSTDIRLTQLDVYSAVNSITAALAPFDPQLQFGFNTLREIQGASSQTSGAETLNSLTQNSFANFNQVLGSGPTISGGFTALKSSSNSAFNFFNPSIGTGLNLLITQPLLQGRGNLQLRSALVVARTQFHIVSEQSQTAIANTLAAAAAQYWEAIRARDAIRIAGRSLDLAQKSYDRDRTALDLGAISKLDILQSQSQVAQRKVDLIQAQFAYQQALDGLRRLIGADLKPNTINAEIVLDDDPLALPPSFEPLSRDKAIAKATHDRPEMSAANRRISIDEWNARVARNSLLPRLDLSVQAGTSGLGGDQIPVVLPLGGGATGFIPGGLGDSLNQLFTLVSPYYGFGLTLTIPIKSSAAKASLADALVNRVRDRYTVRQTEQQIIAETMLAVSQLDLALASVEAAKLSRELAQQNVDAEQQKYQLGTVTAFELLTAQSQLANTESSVVNAYVNYQKSIVAYRRAVWTIFDDYGVVVDLPHPKVP
jgi:outer membrane protein